MPTAVQAPPSTLRSNVTTLWRRRGRRRRAALDLAADLAALGGRLERDRGRRHPRVRPCRSCACVRALSSTTARYSTRRARLEPGDVVEDAVGRVVVGADRLASRRGGPGLERDLVERVAADVGGDLQRGRRAGRRRAERDRRRAPGCARAAGRPVDDRRQRRHRHRKPLRRAGPRARRRRRRRRRRLNAAAGRRRSGSPRSARYSALLSATTYSTCSRGRGARTRRSPRPSSERRCCCAPSRSAGWSRVSRASPAIAGTAGGSGRSSPAPSSRRCRSGRRRCTRRTWLGNMSWRASWSPPSPMKPCSSP